MKTIVILLLLASMVAAVMAAGDDDVFEWRPEIHHVFKEPERMPPTWFSQLFTAITLAPWLVLTIGVCLCLILSRLNCWNWRWFPLVVWSRRQSCQGGWRARVRIKHPRHLHCYVLGNFSGYWIPLLSLLDTAEHFWDANLFCSPRHYHLHHGSTRLEPGSGTKKIDSLKCNPVSFAFCNVIKKEWNHAWYIGCKTIDRWMRGEMQAGLSIVSDIHRSVAVECHCVFAGNVFFMRRKDNYITCFPSMSTYMLCFEALQHACLFGFGLAPHRWWPHPTGTQSVNPPFQAGTVDNTNLNYIRIRPWSSYFTPKKLSRMLLVNSHINWRDGIYLVSM